MDLQRDCLKNCPPVLVAFFSVTCATEFQTLDFHDRGLPDRSHLFIGKYNMSALANVWWDHTPETDLASQFGVRGDCPKLMFAPHAQWDRASFWSKNMGVQWRDWLWDHLNVTMTIENGLDRPISLLLDERASHQHHLLEPGHSRELLLQSTYSIAAIDPTDQGNAELLLWEQLTLCILGR